MSGRYPRVGTGSSVYAQVSRLKPPRKGGVGHQLDNTLSASNRCAIELA